MSEKRKEPPSPKTTYSAARRLMMGEGKLDPKIKSQAFVELGFTSPPGERYSGGSY